MHCAVYTAWSVRGTVVLGQIWTVLVQTKCQLFSFKIVSNAQSDASTGKLLTYNVFCTPKARVMNTFFDIKFCHTGVKSHQPIGVKISDEG